MNKTPAVLVRLSKENFCTNLLARTVYLQGVNTRTASSLHASLCGENAHGSAPGFACENTCAPTSTLISKETDVHCSALCQAQQALSFPLNLRRSCQWHPWYHTPWPTIARTRDPKADIEMHAILITSDCR